MKNKTVHLLAIFLMVYIGVEVTIGGMIFVKLHLTVFDRLENQDGL